MLRAFFFMKYACENLILPLANDFRFLYKTYYIYIYIYIFNFFLYFNSNGGILVVLPMGTVRNIVTMVLWVDNMAFI